ncbi:hypothetical protein F750_0270 [Streptomyces sp. PAMC 26508]|nr:hypothetical protein F750_0270 [Streptomyces sp. PAMC 26508]
MFLSRRLPLRRHRHPHRSCSVLGRYRFTASTPAAGGPGPVGI